MFKTLILNTKLDAGEVSSVLKASADGQSCRRAAQQTSSTGTQSHAFRTRRRARQSRPPESAGISPFCQTSRQPTMACRSLPHDATIPERTTSPEVCALNRQRCGTRDPGTQWTGYPGIPGLSMEAFVLVTALSTNEDNTGWQKKKKLVGLWLCVQACVNDEMKNDTSQSSLNATPPETSFYCNTVVKTLKQPTNSLLFFSSLPFTLMSFYEPLVKDKCPWSDRSLC